MKRIILCLSLFAFFGSQAQQINPVPDYVFSNKMSVGRNAVTDTAAYFSIGPRYGAIRGMMPPMVTDTANMSATKRNGLLIFSIQKNKYLYWDSVGSKWAEMAGTAGSAITGSGVAGYMPEFTTATNLDTTRLYHSAGRFAIGSTTTTNGVFNVYGGQSYFDTSLKVGTQTLLADEGKNEVYVNTTSDAGAYALQVAGSIYNTTGAVFAASSGEVLIGTTTDAGAWALQVNGAQYLNGGLFATGDISSTTNFRFNGADFSQVAIRETGSGQIAGGYNLTLSGATPVHAATASASGYFWRSGNIAFFTNSSASTGTTIPERMRIKDDGEIFMGIGVDQGNFLLQLGGAMWSNNTITTGAPTGGTATAWRWGEAATVSPTSPNRTLRVEVGGTVYYIHAKTTND